MFTNTSSFGGNFIATVKNNFNMANNVKIATGYVSYDTVKKFQPTFENIAKKGGKAQLLLGMAFYEGLSKGVLTLLSDISKSLEGYNNGSGIYVSVDRKYHGKVYYFDVNGQSKYYVGSSNFSSSGLINNIECTVQIHDEDTKTKVSNFLAYLFNSHNAASILHADIIEHGSDKYKKNLDTTEMLSDLLRYDPKSINKSLYPKIEIPLRGSAEQEKSNFNCYFGRGRWSRTTGIVKPRDWYEVEIIAKRDVTSDPLYPKGDFIAYTDDGYIIPMRTQGDYYKNIRSTDSLLIFGMWLKGKLQRNGVLAPLTPVTPDTLFSYGKTNLDLYRIKEGEYYMEF